MPNSRLLPLPEPGEKCWSIETFSAPETVDVLRPAKEYACRDPNAPALVLIPGLSMDSRGFARQLQLGTLADIHSLQANNEGVAGESALGHFARHVEDYILAKGLQNRPGGFVLGGCSMGGAITLATANRGRVSPRALLLLGTFAHCKHLPFYQRWLAPLSWVVPFDFGKRMTRKLARTLQRLKSPFLEDMRSMTEGEVRRTRGYYGRAIMALTRQDQLAAAAKLALPTLVVHGTRNWVLPHAAGEEMAAVIPGARLASIQGAGHIAFYTHAQQVNTEIAHFLDDLKRAGS